jgi:hypothetical protein
MTEPQQQNNIQPLQNNFESSRPFFNNNPEIAPADVEYDQYRYPEVLPNNNRTDLFCSKQVGKSDSSGDKLPPTIAPGMQTSMGQAILPLTDMQQMQQQLQQVMQY